MSSGAVGSAAMDSIATSNPTTNTQRTDDQPQYNISSPPVPGIGASYTGASLSASPSPPAAASGADELDDDQLIEAALKESQTEEEKGDHEEGDEDEEDESANPFSAASIAARSSAGAASGSSAPVEGETYISESGEVLRRRAPRKKKVVEKTEADLKAEEEERKAAAQRAETMLADLLKRTNEVLLRTVNGGGQIAKEAAVHGRKKKADAAPRRKSEKEEDAELLGDLQEDTLPNGAVQLRSQPSIVTGQMRPYQLDGLNWMIRLYHAGVSGILADEMGLGKNLTGPHLVLVPLSTLGNWHREFERWCPSIRCFRFHGTREERAKMVADGMLREENYDVLLTSYEMSILEKSSIAKVKWNFILVDEAHRLKNEGSLLSQIVRLFSSRNRLLITGTPLQNTLHELWALLNFLLPDIFNSGSDFDSMFAASQTDSDVSANLLAQLHKVLRPFMLRRLKAQVATDLPPKKETLLFVGMSELQTKLYRGVLERDIDAVLGKVKEKSRLMNMIMQLRKCSNHPYLFEGVEDRSLPPYGDHLIYTSGKMVVLDKLLARFKAQGSRVLIFSQMTRTLDIMEDYLQFRQYPYSRIDGSTLQEDRETSMREFNAENSEKFVFLLSTRAGGLGINLNTADIVILYDSDWNQIKLRLDAMVIQQGRGAPKVPGGKGAGGMTSDDVSSMIRFGADRIFRQRGSTVTDADIDAILLAGEQRTQELNSKLGKHVGLLDLSLDGAPPMILPDEQQGELPMDELERQMLLNMSDSMGKRDRKVKSYDVNSSFRDQMTTGSSNPTQRSHLPKPYKIPRLPDFQLWQTKRITELSEKEKAWYEEHAFDTSVPPIRGGLTQAEDAELQRLLSEGFADWQWTDYAAFIAGCKRYGSSPSQLEKIIKSMESRSKSRDSIIRYHRTFFERAHQTPGFKSALEKIARGEARTKKFAELEDLLERLLANYPQREDVMERLTIHHTPILKGRGYTLHNDRFLLYWCRLLGYGEWTKLRAQIRRDSEFRFDYFLRSRSCMEINRRVDALLRSMKKEESKQQTKRTKADQARERIMAAAQTLAAQTNVGGNASAELSAFGPSPTPSSSSSLVSGSHGVMPLPSASPLSVTLQTFPPPIHTHSNNLPSASAMQIDQPQHDAADSSEDMPLSIKRKALARPDDGVAAASASSSSAAALLLVDPDPLIPFDESADDLPLIHRKRYLTQQMEQERNNNATQPQPKKQRTLTYIL